MTVHPRRYEVIVERDPAKVTTAVLELMDRVDDLDGLLADSNAILQQVNTAASQATASASQASDAAAQAQAAAHTISGGSRSNFVALNATGIFGALPDGSTLMIDGLAYVRQAGAMAIPDLPGWVPGAPITSGHWGIDNTGATVVDALLRQADTYTRSIGETLHLAPGIFLIAGNGGSGTDRYALNPGTGSKIRGAKWLTRLKLRDGTTPGVAGVRFARGATQVELSDFTIDMNRDGQSPGPNEHAIYYGIKGMRQCRWVTLRGITVANCCGRSIITNQDDQLEDPFETQFNFDETNWSSDWLIEDCHVINGGTKCIQARKSRRVKVSRCSVDTYGIPDMGGVDPDPITGIINGDNCSAFESTQSADVQFDQVSAVHRNSPWGVTCRVTNGSQDVIYTNVQGRGGRQFASIGGRRISIIGGIGTDTCGMLAGTEKYSGSDWLLSGIVLNGIRGVLGATEVDGYGLSTGAYDGAVIRRLAVRDCVFIKGDNGRVASFLLNATAEGTVDAHESGNVFLGEPTVANRSGRWKSIGELSEDFVPTLTFQTPGDVSWTYTTQVGRYWTQGELVFYKITVQATVMHSTAAGDLRIDGLQIACNNTSELRGFGTGAFRGITYTGMTQVTPFIIQGTTQIGFRASGSGINDFNVQAGQIPSGGDVRFEISGWYPRRVV